MIKDQLVEWLNGQLSMPLDKNLHAQISCRFIIHRIDELLGELDDSIFDTLVYDGLIESEI